MLGLVLVNHAPLGDAILQCVKHVMGDLQEQSLCEIWNAPAYRSFREQLFKGRSSIEICRNCTAGTKVFES